MSLSLSSNVWYQLSNNYTGSTSYLAAGSINGALFMSNSSSATTQWQFLDHNNHTYSIKNQAAGSDFQLGIEYGTPTDRIIAKPVLQNSKAKTQSQQWVFLPEEDGFTVANVQLGNIFFLDLLADTLEPCMDTWGGYSSQFWMIEEVDPSGHVSSTSSSTESNSTATIKPGASITPSQSTTHLASSTSASLPTESSFKSKLLPMGVIFGIAFGILLLGMITAMGFGCWIFNFRQERALRALHHQIPEDTYITVPVEKPNSKSRRQHDAEDGILSESQPEKERNNSKVQFELQETYR
ncbi:hypothetical protein BGZ60DRAFT_527562 [Tricladium varicosporioides]|nr:hypothetical protein BGZ60DRAFT_527562 [Hymenoscyphus varicosporioides]